MTDISFSLVPEWAPQSALWIGWPRLAHDWPEGLVTAREEAANLIRNASRFVSVKVSIGGPRSMADALKRELDEVADLYPVSATDVWLRDTGPIVGFDEVRSRHRPSGSMAGVAGSAPRTTAIPQARLPRSKAPL